MVRHALIMAAGRGTRMSPLTDTIPKPMAPYNGSTLIARGIAKLTGHIENVHITVGYKKAMLAAHVIGEGVNSVFNTEGKGNSWWIYNTLLKNIDEPIYVLTCDNVIELDFDLLEANYEALNRPPCMLVPVKPIEGLDGDFIFHENQVVTEISRVTEADIYCSGIQILNPARINQLTLEGESFYDLWQQLIKQSLLKVSSVYPKRWFAVDTVEQLMELNKNSL